LKKEKRILASKVAKFQQNPSQFCHTQSINRNKPNHTHDHKAITKLKISETHQQTTKSTQLCKKPAQINNQSRKIISNFKSDPESIKIPSSNLELASILKSNPKPMTLIQITNTKILSLNKSKLKQFLSLKMSIEQIFTMEKSQRTKFQKKKKKNIKKKSPRIKNSSQ
jgi:hypothetical protein